MDTDTPKQPNKAIIAIVVIVLLAAVTTAVIVLGGKKEDAPSTNTTSQTESTDTSSPTSSTATDGTYKDGTYSASGTYQTPGGVEKVTVKVTLAGGVINSVDMERDPTTPEAEEYQGRFVDGYKSQVEGKKIDEVTLNRVAGSSLTSGGFNKALDTIKNDARA